VYRRKDLERWSNSVDRHLKTLVDAGDLKRIRHGMYYCPKKFAFGEAPPVSANWFGHFLGPTTLS